MNRRDLLKGIIGVTAAAIALPDGTADAEPIDWNEIADLNAMAEMDAERDETPYWTIEPFDWVAPSPYFDHLQQEILNAPGDWAFRFPNAELHRIYVSTAEDRDSYYEYVQREITPYPSLILDDSMFIWVDFNDLAERS